MSPTRAVPSDIARPPYAASGHVDDRGAPCNDPHELAQDDETLGRMRSAGRAARRVLGAVAAEVAPGVTTDHLDAVCHQACIDEGGYPSPLNYKGYPKSLCTSVNEVICHGIPDSRPLADGDIVNCDVTIFLDGVHGDHSETFLVGDVDEASRQLVKVTREAMYAGIGAVRAGAVVSDIGRAIQDHAQAHGYGVVRDFVGHGIGTVFHQDPSIPHYYLPTANMPLVEGLTFTIEPMITIGRPEAALWRDNWTAVTVDGSRTAQFEHTLAVTAQGAEILTVGDDEPQPFVSGASRDTAQGWPEQLRVDVATSNSLPSVGAPAD